MAQTTRLALFGPVFIIAAQSKGFRWVLWGFVCLQLHSHKQTNIYWGLGLMHLVSSVKYEPAM